MFSVLVSKYLERQFMGYTLCPAGSSYQDGVRNARDFLGLMPVK